MSGVEHLGGSELERVLLSGRRDLTLSFFAGTDEAERRAAAPTVLRLLGRTKGRRVTERRFEPDGREVLVTFGVDDWRAKGGGDLQALALACAATLATTELTKAFAQEWIWPRTDVVAAVLADRDQGWLTRTLETWWSRTPARTPLEARIWRTAEALRRRLQLPQPAADFYRYGAMTFQISPCGEIPLHWPTWNAGESWVVGGEDLDWLQGAFPDVLRAQRHPDVLLQWTPFLLERIVAGALDRDLLLDLCLDALLAAKTPAEVRFSFDTLTALTPVGPDASRRPRDFLALLSLRRTGYVSTVLELLIDADTEHPLDADVLLEAIGRLLERPDKKPTVRALTWVRSLARQRPELAAELALAVSRGFSNPDRAQQDRALAAVSALAPRESWPAETLRSLRGRLEGLDAGVRAGCGELRLALDRALGDRLESLARGAEASSAAGAPSGNHAPAVPADLKLPAPSRLRDASEYLELLVCETGGDFDAELLIEATPRLTPDQVAAIHARLTAMIPRSKFITHIPSTADALSGANRRIARQLLPRFDPSQRRPGNLPDAAPAGLLAWRTHEALRGGEPILAFPDDGTGFVDPERIASQLAAAREAGRRIRPSDLLQTALRIPVTAQPGAQHPDHLVRVLRGIGHPDADWLAATVSRPLPQPVVTITDPVRVESFRYDRQRPGASWRAVTALVPTPDWPKLRRGDPPAELDLTAALVRFLEVPPALELELTSPIPFPPFRPNVEKPWPRGWRLMLPGHREFLACYLQQRVASSFSVPPEGLLALLPVLGGSVGAGTHLALAYAATMDSAAGRAGAADAIIGFIARDNTCGGLDPAVLGRAWADLLRIDPYPMLARWSAVLRDVTGSSASGARFVADFSTTLLGEVLAREETSAPFARRSGAHELFAAAAEAVLAAPRPDRKVAGLTEFAGAGRSRARQEAQRLLRALR